MVIAARLPIVQYWHSRRPPDYVADLIETFRDRNPHLRHMLFDEKGAETFIAEHFTAREVEAFRSCAVPAMQSDYFRYCAVLAMGGVYCDIGYRCIASMHTLLDDCGEGRLFRRPTGQVVNGLFGFDSPGHPLLELALSVATVNVEKHAGAHVWQATGPAIFTALWRAREASSIESLVAESREMPEGNLHPAASALATLVDRATLLDATEDVALAPLKEVGRWLDRPGRALPYRESSTHWLGYASPIFRDGTVRDGS